LLVSLSNFLHFNGSAKFLLASRSACCNLIIPSSDSNNVSLNFITSSVVPLPPNSLLFKISLEICNSDLTKPFFAEPSFAILLK